MARTLRDRLMDELRFGPMAHYMMGWPMAQKDMLVGDLADDLLRSGLVCSHDRPEDDPADKDSSDRRAES